MFDDILEDKEESFHCECGGEITIIDGYWQCSLCEFKKEVIGAASIEERNFIKYANKYLRSI